MASEVSNSARDTQPYSCIGLIWVTFPDGHQARGTCAVVGRNDILTATHVVYDPDHGGWVEEYDFYFGADYNDVTDRFDDFGFSYTPDDWTTWAWTSQTFSDGDNSTMTQAEAEYDTAIIGVDEPIGDIIGWLGIDPAYDRSLLAKAVGYPAGATGMMQETVAVNANPYYGLYTSAYDVLGPGSSGGPLLVGNYVIGVKSTGSWWADVGFLYDSLLDIIDENDSLLFSTPGDSTAPAVTAFSPADGATGVATTANIVLTFDESIQRGAGNIILKTAAGTVVESFDAATSSRLAIAGTTLTIDPVNTLAHATGYTVAVAAGTVKDLAGNPFAGTNAYDFTTAADTGASASGALPGFDKAYYLLVKLTALQADPATSLSWLGKDTAFLEGVFAEFGLTTEAHYMTWGYQEGLAPNAFFDAAEYKLAKATALFAAGGYASIAAASADFTTKWPHDAYQHYLQYGSKEGINPSNDFDESSYYDAKLADLVADPLTAATWSGKSTADLKALFDSLDLTPLHHYMTWGASEGIAVTPVPAGERVDVTASSTLLHQEQVQVLGVSAADWDPPWLAA